jgi:hypothetical protein
MNSGNGCYESVQNPLSRKLTRMQCILPRKSVSQLNTWNRTEQRYSRAIRGDYEAQAASLLSSAADRLTVSAVECRRL